MLSKWRIFSRTNIEPLFCASDRYCIESQYCFVPGSLSLFTFKAPHILSRVFFFNILFLPTYNRQNEFHSSTLQMLSPYLVIFILMFFFFDNYFESSTIFITNVRGEHARVYICISYLLNSQSKSHQSVRRCVMVTCMIRSDGELVPFYYFLHDGSLGPNIAEALNAFVLLSLSTRTVNKICEYTYFTKFLSFAAFGSLPFGFF